MLIIKSMHLITCISGHIWQIAAYKIIMVCSCIVPSKHVLLQIIFCSCMIGTTFLREKWLITSLSSQEVIKI